MSLQNSHMLNCTSLTNTENTLLNQSDYKYVSVKSSLQLDPVFDSCSYLPKVIYDGSTFKGMCNLTSARRLNKPLHGRAAQISLHREKSREVLTKRKCKRHKTTNEKAVTKKARSLQTDMRVFPETQLFCDAELSSDNIFEGAFDSNEAILCTLASQPSTFGSSIPKPGAKPLVFGSSMPSSSMPPPVFGFGMPSAQSGFFMPGSGTMMPQENTGFTFGDSFMRCAPSKKLNFERKEMPVYDFTITPAEEFTAVEYLSLEEDIELQKLKKQNSTMGAKVAFLNAVSTSLMCSPNYKSSDDTFRNILTDIAEKVVIIDPEFILKVALYTRQELNIRTTSNFLLAYAAYTLPCRMFLKKYFSAVINLPSDWVEVAEIYVTFKDSQLKPRSLPSVLRKVMVTSFQKFDEYQLAKYNKKKKLVKCSMNLESEENLKSFTLKQLIRALHIAFPVEPVMCLLGKKYPADSESFRKCGLQGTWCSERAGKRMKLPIPETWETKISKEGNKAHVWENLIENSKLPYMALLRNLRNLIMTNISEYYRKKVIEKIMNKKAVLKSRQLPLRFYSAYKTIEEIEHVIDFPDEYIDELSNISKWKKKKRNISLTKINGVDKSVLKGYKSALNKALEISVINNVDPIGGKTVIICDLVKGYKENNTKASNANKAHNNCILLGLICMKACEDCEMKLIHGMNDITNVEINSQSILQNMSRLTSMKKPCSETADAETELLCGLNIILESYLCPDLLFTKKINNIVFLQSSHDIDANTVKKTMNSFLHKYRHLSNPELLYVQVNISSSSGSKNTFDQSEHINDIYLNGFSDQILKFIAEKGNGRQLAYVEAIDQKYNLSKDTDVYMRESVTSNKNEEKFQLPLYDMAIKWQTLRIFISSTFKDMQGERDLLMRYVFPELKRRAFSLSLKIIEIDLRWGISEEYSASKKCAEICLQEAQNCDIFIGILGERYGTLYNFDTPDGEEFSWIRQYQSCPSITELEMEAGAFRRIGSSKFLSFFYIRNNEFISNVPKEWTSCFSPENNEAKQRLLSLKSKIRNSEVNLYDGYPCHWGGVYKDTPFVDCLEVFGNRVLNDLWQEIQRTHDKLHTLSGKCNLDEIEDEYLSQQLYIGLHNYYVAEENSPLMGLLEKLKSQTGIFVITGQTGYGKSAFMAKLIKKIGIDNVIPFSIGTTSRSTELSYVLRCIAHFIAKTYPISSVFSKIKQDITNQFYDILVEGANASGGNLIIFIDGLDHLDLHAQTLDWLPCNIPSGVRIICSASESSTACKVLFKRAQNGFPVHFAPINQLNVSNRKVLVKKLLGEHSKFLDEGAFNNQMMQLITKRECGIPLYIYLACEYLKIYATYKTLTATIQNLPSTLPLLLENIIIQMEKQHGSSTVCNALTLLCTVKEGLEESELHRLLNCSLLYSIDESLHDLEKFLSFEHKFPNEKLTLLDFRLLLHTIQNFVFRQKRVNFMKITFPIIVDVLKKSYTGYEENVKFCHRLLGACYRAYATRECCNRWCGLSSSALRSIPYHLYHGQMYHQLAEMLCSLEFIKAVFQKNATDDFCTYYMLLLELHKKKSLDVNENKFDAEKLNDYYAFVSHNFHILIRYPQLVHQQALNEPTDSAVALNNITTSSMKCLTPNFDNYRWHTIQVLENITSVAIHSFKPVAAIGNKSGSIKVFNHYTGKVLCCLKGGPTSAVISTNFLGNDHLCYSTDDNTIYIWNITDSLLVAVLTGHTRYVSSCIVDPTEKFILSSSWDCSIRFWSVPGGSEVSTLTKFCCPVNCIAHHPYSMLFACGLWNSNIEIWDSLSLEKKKVLSGHTGSIKDLTYSSDGLSIFSSSSTSEVFIWSSMDGLRIGNLKGHTFNIESIQYSMKQNIFLCAGEDSILRVWLDKQQQPVHILCDTKVCQIHFMEIVQTNQLAVAFKNGVVWIYDLLEGRINGRYGNLTEKVTCFSKYLANDIGKSVPEENSNSLICGTMSGRIMALRVGNENIKVIYDHNSTTTYLTHTNHLVFVGTSNGDVGLLHISNSDSNVIICGAHDGSVTALSFSLLGNEGWGVSASTDKTLKLWKMQYDEKVSLQEYKTFGCNHKDYVTSCFFLPLDDMEFSNIKFVSGSADNSVAFWNSNKPMIFEGLHSAVIRVYCIKSFIVGCGQDGGVAMWTTTGTLIAHVDCPLEQCSTLAYDVHETSFDSSDINLILACVDSYGNVLIKKPFQRSLLYTLEGHSKAITSCSVSESGTAISSAPDNTVNIWKFSEEALQYTTMGINVHNISHDGLISGIIFIDCANFVLSSDVNGTLILWRIKEETELNYCHHKKYARGSISDLSSHGKDEYACAVTIMSGDRPINFLSIIRVDFASAGIKNSFDQIREAQRFYVKDQILCIDYLHETCTTILSLKSGHIFLLNELGENYIKIANDWILKGIISNKGPKLCTIEYNGNVKLYTALKLVESKSDKNCLEHSFSLSENQDRLSIWATAVCTDNLGKLYIGDSTGWLRIVSDKILFSKQVHTDAITGVCTNNFFIMTCSSDGLVKVWDIKENTQLGQFHSDISISCMAIQCDGQSDENPLVLIGSTFGKVQLLKWWL